LIEPETANT
jgi:chromate transporter